MDEDHAIYVTLNEKVLYGWESDGLIGVDDHPGDRTPLQLARVHEFGIGTEYFLSADIPLESEAPAGGLGQPLAVRDARPQYEILVVPLSHLTLMKRLGDSLDQPGRTVVDRVFAGTLSHMASHIEVLGEGREVFVFARTL